MKKVITAFALLFVAGILAGGAYDWWSNHSAENAGRDRIRMTAEKSESIASSSESAEEVDTTDKTIATSKERRVTNPDKICSTPGCGRAVFVTYKGEELCVKCYGEAKKRDTEQ